MKRAVCIMSGGMDSTLAAYMMKKRGYAIIALHFSYLQRTQKRELEAYERVVAHLGTERHYEIDINFFQTIGASALTDSTIDIPVDGVEKGVPATYVPFRNGIFLSIATAIAEKHGASAVVIGVVEEDSSGYPDCKEDYISSMEKSVNLGTKDETKITIERPLVKMKKEQIVKEALALDVPLGLTWSCYKNSTDACGVCDSCRLRLKGFKLAGTKDPISYA